MNAAGAPASPVAHPAETAAVVADARALISTLRVADAPVDVLQHAAALLREATDLLAPYDVDATRSQAALHVPASGLAPLETLNPSRFFPYSPVVGPLNPIAPPLTFTFDGQRLAGTGALSAAYAGPPGTLHGGVIALILDELLGAVNACRGMGAYTGTLSVRYELPTPIDQELEFESWVDRSEGRKVFTIGTVSADGVVTARAEGVFIRVEGGAVPAS